MLSYNIKINSESRKDYLNLEDFYIKPDLTILSGTTSEIQNLSKNDDFWVLSQYLSFDKKVEVDFFEKVVRNGYVLYRQDLEIQNLYYHNEAQGMDMPIYFVELNDVIYYEKNGVFDIEGDFISVKENQSTISVQRKAYVENGKVNINGEIYNVIVNDDGVIISDSMGNGCSYDIITSHINKKPVEVCKIGFKNDPETIIDIKNVTKFGYIPFIDYNGERLEFQKLLSNEGDFEGYGVVINSKNYPIETLSNDNFEMGLSNPENYQILEFNGDLGLDVDGVEYKIQFEPRDYEDGDFLCLETDVSNPTVMIGDNVVLKSTDYTTTVDVLGEGENRYTFVNGVRFNSIKNLCDSITIGSESYLLNYQGDSSTPYEGMLATVDYGNDIETFKVTSVANRTVTGLVKVKKRGDDWQDAYTVIKGISGNTEYVKATNYHINHNDGFLIDGYVYPIETEETYDSEGFAIDSKDVIKINKPTEYELKVYSVLGSNKIICTANIDKEVVQTEDYYNQKNIIYSTLINNDNFVMYRRGSLFGIKPLTVKKWLKEAVEAPEPSSTYILSQSSEKIRPYRENDAFAVSVSLSSDVNNDILREDLLTSYYCTDKEEYAVNKIVDMEKDIYTPIIRTENNVIDVGNIKFNLHFRTRDLDSWRMIKDEGENDAVDYGTYNSRSEKLDVANDFSNWFITDYYPYNQIIESGDNQEITNLMNMSDLLGFLYFTTNDIEENRPKVSKSFLRLTYYDSRDPDKQNMLGTSTVYFDMNNYFNILKKAREGEDVVYEGVVMSTNPNRTTTSVNTDCFEANTGNTLGVLMEAYNEDESKLLYTTWDLSYDEEKRLSSHINISDRYDTSHSSEGFYAYLLKNIANKKEKQTIYLKIEFFHAGLGIKIPMAIATDTNKKAISVWNRGQIDSFKKGYKPNEVHMRQYIPIDISYSPDRREFVYEISSSDNYLNAIKQGNDYVFNLFELKVAHS